MPSSEVDLLSYLVCKHTSFPNSCSGSSRQMMYKNDIIIIISINEVSILERFMPALVAEEIMGSINIHFFIFESVRKSCRII